MTEAATITVETPAPETATDITLAIVAGAAIATADNAEETADEALQVSEAADETADEAVTIATEARETALQNEDNLEWLKDRVVSLEALQASPQPMTETPNLSTPQPLEGMTETDPTDPTEVAETDPTISTLLSTSEPESETPTEATPESVVAVVIAEAPARPRKRRMLI